MRGMPNIKKSRAVERKKLRSRHPPADAPLVSSVRSYTPRTGIVGGRADGTWTPAHIAPSKAKNTPRGDDPPVWLEKLVSAGLAIGWRYIFAGTEDLVVSSPDRRQMVSLR